MKTRPIVTGAAVAVLLVYAFAVPGLVSGAGAPEVLWQTNVHGSELQYLVGSLSFSYNGSLLASAGYTADRKGYIWRTSEGSLYAELAAPYIYENEEVYSVAYSPTTNTMVMVSSFEGRETSTTRVKFLGWGSGWPQWDLFLSGGGRQVDHASFSPDGLQIALPYTVYQSSADISFFAVDSLAGDRLGEFYLEDVLEDVIFRPSYGWSRDQRYFASVGKYEYCDPDEPNPTLALACGWHALLWDAQTFSFLRQLQGHFGNTSRVAFSPTEDILATGGGDGMIRLWNIPEGTTNREFYAYTNGITSLSYAHDGRLLVCSDGKSIKFWRVADGELLCTYDEGLPTISSLAVSPDQRHFAVGGMDRSVTVARMPLWISDLSMAGENASIRWYGGSGLYQVQACTNLLEGEWQNFGAPTRAMSATNVSSASMFFRVQSLPNP